MRRSPWTRIRSVPSGTRIILWITAAVPISYRSSHPGCSASLLRTVTSASSRSPETTSSISLIDRSWPIASGVIDSGKTTVSFSGSTGSAGGSSTSSGLACSSSRGSATPLSPLDLHLDRAGALLRDREHDRQETVLVLGDRAARIDVLVECDLAL